MTNDEFIKIMRSDGVYRKLVNDDRVFLGLVIIRKYSPKKGIEGADHDLVYSVYVSELVDAGITTEDTKELRSLGWMTDEEENYLSCYV